MWNAWKWAHLKLYWQMRPVKQYGQSFLFATFFSSPWHWFFENVCVCLTRNEHVLWERKMTCWNKIMIYLASYHPKKNMWKYTFFWNQKRSLTDDRPLYIILFLYVWLHRVHVYSIIYMRSYIDKHSKPFDSYAYRIKTYQFDSMRCGWIRLDWIWFDFV